MVTTHSAPASPWEQADLDQLNHQFRTDSAEAIITWAATTFGEQVVLTCSFGGASGMVLLDMVVRLARTTPVVFLDTNLLFAETYKLAEQAAQHYGLEIQRRVPSLSLEQQAASEGPDLFMHNPDRCCAIRKVAPLAEALSPYQAWISGIRRDQSATRANTEQLQWSERHQLLKISPLAYWSEREVWAYISKHRVPYNPLLNQGYPSLGCTPCTRPASSADPRGGRWAGFTKTECGIHL